jgi:hypothetical protein
MKVILRAAYYRRPGAVHPLAHFLRLIKDIFLEYSSHPSVVLLHDFASGLRREKLMKVFFSQ